MKQQAYTPKMSDVAVTANTGKDWKSWFAILDKAGAAMPQASADGFP